MPPDHSDLGFGAEAGSTKSHMQRSHRRSTKVCTRCKKRKTKVRPANSHSFFTVLTMQCSVTLNSPRALPASLQMRHASGSIPQPERPSQGGKEQWRCPGF